MVYSYSKLIYVCTCDKCNKQIEVESDNDKIYNSAQAVRSVGWSFGRDGKVKCIRCRRLYIRNRFIKYE